MLNELLVVERGAPRQELAAAMRHADIHDARRISTLHVWLDATGHVVNVSPVPKEVRLWTLRNHNENSFPFIQMKSPLWEGSAAKTWQDWKAANSRAKPHESRDRLLDLARCAELRREHLGKWATKTVMTALQERLSQVDSLRNTIGAALPAALERFLRACDSTAGGDVGRFLAHLRDRLVEALKTTASDALIDCSVAILAEGNSAFYVDADGEWPFSLTDTTILSAVTDALDNCRESADAVRGTCALTGQTTELLDRKSPSANLPTIGPTILFSRYEGRPANDRYGRFGVKSMPLGDRLARRLAAAARVLTVREREGTTWRPIPGERPQQRDLLIAFVEAAADAAVAGVLAEDDFSEETPESAADAANSVAAFEKRASRLIDAVRAKVGVDFRDTPVRLAVLRKVDRANRKVICAGAPTVGAIFDAATGWAAGEGNVPPWLTLPVPPRGQGKPRFMPPQHVAPLGMIALTKQVYIRGGTERQEVVGISANQALRLFLDGLKAQASLTERWVERILRMVLQRRSGLMLGVGHLRHTPESWRRRRQSIKTFDHREALRSVTVLGVLLHKLGRLKEVYMNDAAFKLGQLLAAVDVVHAGYCADVRAGDVPPSLLGNQVFAMAQNTPQKSLAVLCRRWKPYAGWIAKASRDRTRADGLIASRKKEDQQRGWDIRKALRHAREVQPLANDLASLLAECRVDETFRAELLLGYIAGLRKTQKDEASTDGGESKSVLTQED